MHRATSILLLSALILTPGCRREPTNARVDAAIAPLIPSGTVALAGLRLDRLKSTKFFEKYVQGQQISALNEFRDKTGLDPTKDIWELDWAFRPDHSLVFIRGKFGGEFGFEPKFNMPGIQRMSHKGYYLLHKDGQGVLFFNSGVAVAGLVPDLQAVVDNRDKAGEVPPRELIDMVTTLPACHAWFVTRQGGAMVPELPKEGNFANFTRMATSLGAATMYADLTDGVDLKAEADYPDPLLAKQVHDALRGVLGLLRLRTSEDHPELLRALDGVRVSTQDRKVLVTAVAPFGLIDQIIHALPASAREGVSGTRPAQPAAPGK